MQLIAVPSVKNDTMESISPLSISPTTYTYFQDDQLGFLVS